MSSIEIDTVGAVESAVVVVVVVVDVDVFDADAALPIPIAANAPTNPRPYPDIPELSVSDDSSDALSKIVDNEVCNKVFPFDIDKSVENSP